MAVRSVICGSFLALEGERKHERSSSATNDLELVDSLNNASSLDLFRLSTLIERLLADPKRIIVVRQYLILGQTVRRHG